MEYYSVIKKNTFESVLMRWMKLEPIIPSEVSQKEKHQYSMKVKVKLLSRVRLFAIPWTVAYQAPPSMGFFQARILEWGAIAFSGCTLHIS